MSNARSMPEESGKTEMCRLSFRLLELYFTCRPPSLSRSGAASLISAGSRMLEEEMETAFPGLSFLYRQHTAKKRRRQNGS